MPVLVEDPRVEKRIAAIGYSKSSLTRSLYRYHELVVVEPGGSDLVRRVSPARVHSSSSASSLAVCTLLLPCSTVTSPLF